MDYEQLLAELHLTLSQTNDWRLTERYQAVILHLEGKKTTEIAQIIQRDPSTVRNYINTFKAGGITSLQMGYSSGKPSKLSAEQRIKLAEVISTKVPADVGFPDTYHWTLSLITQWVINEWQITYSLRGMSKLLKKMGFSYTYSAEALEGTVKPSKKKYFLR